MGLVDRGKVVSGYVDRGRWLVMWWTGTFITRTGGFGDGWERNWWIGTIVRGTGGLGTIVREIDGLGTVERRTAGLERL